MNENRIQQLQMENLENTIKHANIAIERKIIGRFGMTSNAIIRAHNMLGEEIREQGYNAMSLSSLQSSPSSPVPIPVPDPPNPIVVALERVVVGLEEVKDRLPAKKRR